MPLADIVATLVLLLLHAPPGTVSANVTVAPLHTPVGPDIVPASGSGFIVTVIVATAVPHVLVTVYCIVSVPLVTPVTTPAADMVAFPVVVLHTPPAVEFVSVIVAPGHTLFGPVMVPAVGSGFTVITDVPTLVHAPFVAVAV